MTSRGHKCPRVRPIEAKITIWSANAVWSSCSGRRQTAMRGARHASPVCRAAMSSNIFQHASKKHGSRSIAYNWYLPPHFAHLISVRDPPRLFSVRSVLVRREAGYSKFGPRGLDISPALT
jgi:hypothetical protein